MCEKKQAIVFLQELARSMPRTVRFSIAWVMKNIDLVDKLFENCYMTDTERKISMDAAWSRQEYRLWALQRYQQFKQEQRHSPLS